MSRLRGQSSSSRRSDESRTRETGLNLRGSELRSAVLGVRGSLLESIEIILAWRGPLRVGAIVDELNATGQLRTRALVPEGVIAKHLSLEIRDNPSTPFCRVSPGLYWLRED